MIIEPATERKFTRIHSDRHVNLEFVRVCYDSCQITNLSLTGMFAKGPFQDQVGKYCLINLVQPGAPSDSCLQASAKVVRKDDNGLAVEFTSMPYDSYMFLQAILLSEADIDCAALSELPDDNCPFEITDQLPICLDTDCLAFLH